MQEKKNRVEKVICNEQTQVIELRLYLPTHDSVALPV